jgi:hypothetical protein
MAERHFLADTIGSEPTFSAEPWYNQHGDCLVYKMANEASVADRIDELLPIYRSAEDSWQRGRRIARCAGDRRKGLGPGLSP